jgi:hypothetical protein
LYLTLKKELVKSYILSIALYGAETFDTLENEIRNNWKVLKYGAGEG